MHIHAHAFYIKLGSGAQVCYNEVCWLSLFTWFPFIDNDIHSFGCLVSLIIHLFLLRAHVLRITPFPGRMGGRRACGALGVIGDLTARSVWRQEDQASCC